MFDGPVEVDETYFGGLLKNMSNAKRRAPRGNGRGAVGKAADFGAKDRATNEVAAKAVENTDTEVLQGFVVEKAAPGGKAYTDDAGAYAGMLFDDATVRHSLSE